MTLKRLISGCLVLGLTAWAAAAPPSFRVVLLQPAAPEEFPLCEATAMSQSGVVAGVCRSRNLYFTQATYWDTHGHAFAIPAVDSYRTTWMIPTGVNDHGEIVGDAIPDRRGAYGWAFSPERRTRPLGRDSYDSRVRGINNSGTAVGAFTPRGARTRPQRAVAWTRESGQGDLIELPMEGLKGSSAVAINDSGQVLIQANAGFDHGTSALMQADGSYTLLPGLAKNGAVMAPALSSTGLVAGRRYLPNQHAFIWEGGSLVDLGTLSGMGHDLMSIAYGVNGSGQAVGYSDVLLGPDITGGAAFYFDKTHGMLNLVDLISAGDPLAGRIAFDAAIAVNDAGWVLANGIRTDRSARTIQPMVLMPVAN